MLLRSSWWCSGVVDVVLPMPTEAGCLSCCGKMASSAQTKVEKLLHSMYLALETAGQVVRTMYALVVCCKDTCVIIAVGKR